MARYSGLKSSHALQNRRAPNLCTSIEPFPFSKSPSQGRLPDFVGILATCYWGLENNTLFKLHIINLSTNKMGDCVFLFKVYLKKPRGPHFLVVFRVTKILAHSSFSLQKRKPYLTTNFTYWSSAFPCKPDLRSTLPTRMELNPLPFKWEWGKEYTRNRKK